jgi:hypothetical protein
MEILCRIADRFSPGKLYQMNGKIEPINGLFKIEAQSQCENCQARNGKVQISGGVVIKNLDDEWKVNMGLARSDDIEHLNVVTSCEKV